MLFVNCAVEENSPIEVSIDSSSSINVVKKKYTDKTGLTFHESNMGSKIEGINGSINALGKIDLRTSFTNDGKHKNTDPIEFFILGSDWSGPDLILGKPWLQKNNAIVNICDNQLIIHDNFAIPIMRKEFILVDDGASESETDSSDPEK